MNEQILDVLIPLAGLAGLIAFAAGLRFGVPAAVSAFYLRYVWTPRDRAPRRWSPRHVMTRGRPALVAYAATEHVGADYVAPDGTPWSPKAEVDAADAAREPEEQLAEAAEREAAELTRQRAEQEKAVEESVTTEWARVLDPKLEPLHEAVDRAARAALRALGIGLDDEEIDKLLSRHQAAAEPTGEWPTVEIRMPETAGAR